MANNNRNNLTLTLPPRTILSSKSTDTLRTIISASEAYSVATPDNTQQITDLSNRFTGFEREDIESDGDGPRPSFNQKHFMKDPMALHRSIHTSVELLKFNGEKFYCLATATRHYLRLLEPLLFKSVRNARKPADIYRTLKTRCKRSDRQRKITIVNKLKDFYAYEQQESNAELIAQIQDFFLEVSQQNLSIDELLGLVLQSVAKPLLALTRTFSATISTIASTVPPLLHSWIPGTTTQRARTPHPEATPPLSATKHSPMLLAFQGQQPSTALMAAKGDTCKYCEIKGHWASTCRKFAPRPA
ncbi:hypothetical protein KEM48_007292 [Puccinia striiformis f. sp. tritici PST-130]|nr:hypothetical protein KEM48_007292 [Puccinia striiformis f. sp. tritici PST-130]